MPARDDPDYEDKKNNEQKKRIPRRLFSFDSIKSNNSSRQSLSDHEATKGNLRTTLSPSELSSVREGDKSLAGDRAGQVTLVEEPMSDINSSANSTRSSTRLEPIRTASIPSRPPTPDNAPSVSSNTTRARWDNLRYHVLPSRTRPPSPLQKQPTPVPLFTPPSRPSTPKPSGLSRLGFRQVVEQAREVIDDTRKFGKDILKACAAARYTEGPRSTKDRDGPLSPISLSGTVASTSTASGKKMEYFPQSIASLASPLVFAVSGSTSGPSLKLLYQVLIHYSRPLAEAGQRILVHLPHESYVLGTLLSPFLTPSKYPFVRIEEEKATAVEAFELILKIWTLVDESASVERCLWCTKAAATIGPGTIRTRILTSLWLLLVPADQNRILLTTHGFKSVTSGLLILLATLHYSSSSTPTTQTLHPDVQVLVDLIQHFLSGSFGDLEDDHMEEVYGIEYGVDDRRQASAVRRAVFLEGLVGCIEHCLGTDTGVWMLENLLEDYWSLPSTNRLTPLQSIICSRKLSACCRFSLKLLQPTSSLPSNKSPISPPPTSPPSVHTPPPLSPPGSAPLSYSGINPKLPPLIIALLQKRAIPEAELLTSTGPGDDQAVLGARMGVVNVVFSVLCLGLDFSEDIGAVGSPLQRDDVFGGFSPRAVHGTVEIKQMVKWAAGLLCQWYKAGNDLPWRAALERTLTQVIKDGWDNAIRTLTALLRFIPEEVRKSVFISIFPILNDQLVDDPPPYPSRPLTFLLNELSKIYPLVFFKPIIACATSDQEFTVVNHLCILHVHAKYVQDYWVRQVEMMCVALLKDPGTGVGVSTGQWGVARLGQLVLLVELIGNVQSARHAKEAAANTLDTTFVDVIRFVTALEQRLSTLIEEKETKILIPPSQRTLLCILFREIRLLTRSLKPAPWLSRILSWFYTFWTNEDVTEDLQREVTNSMKRIQGLYAAAQEGVQQNERRRNSMFSANTKRTTPVNPNIDEAKRLDLSSTFVEHRKLIDSLSKGYPPKAMKLFVSLSAIIEPDDYQRLGPLLWEFCLERHVGSSSTTSACFLLMQCAEKAPRDLLAAIEVDLQTSDDMTRLEAVRKVSILINWRFQIVSQNILIDRTHRPFKLARSPLQFHATDLGTNLYVHADEPSENRDTDEVPLELKKRLAELGWVEEGAGMVDQRKLWIRTPLSLLPASQLDRMDGRPDDNSLSPNPNLSSSPKRSVEPSPQIQQQAGEVALLRRNSSSGGPMNAVKRKAVFVPSLTAVFRRLATLVYDPNFAVASAARMTLLDLMRNDPGLLTRPTFDLFVGEHKDIQSAVSTFTALLHIHRVLPPPLTHHIFNHLAGFLKMAARQLDASDSLHDFGQTIRVLINMATQVSEMSIREIKRSKIEPLMIPTGSLWYPSASKGPMFPTNLGTSDDPFEPVLNKLTSITMVRVSQNIFFLSMLKRNYQDVQVIRKTMSRLVLPSLEAEEVPKALEIQDFIPRKRIPSDRPSSRNSLVDDLSLMVARSYVLLAAQIFRSMSRHLNDRNELAVLVDGLNRMLLVHGNDINIVSQVLIALMVASTRFRRLFTSGGGYTLFMPSLVKLYVEAPSHPGIRTAIEYAISRFYALHKESFLFQSIDTIGQIALLTDDDADWFSKGVYNMFFSLRRGNTPSTVDVAAIHNANKAQERQALLIHTADETPQTFFETLRQVDSQTGHQMSLQFPDEYETTRLNMDDFVRLLLTVIAHDLTVARARHFLRLLRFLVPHLYNCSTSTRNVLIEAIPALGQILMKTFAKPKGGDSGPRGARREDDNSSLPSKPGSEGPSTEKVGLSKDTIQIRLDYLHFILAFGEAGGQISLSVARQMLDILKGLLKDWSESSFDALSSFLSSFVQMLLVREDAPPPKFVVSFLHDLSPILHAYMIAMDFTGVLETISELSEMPVYANDITFSQAVISDICTPGLAACELAASENRLMTLRYRPALVSLLGEAIFLRRVDIIAELQKRAPTYLFLSGVILPLVLTMKTDSQLITDGLRTGDHRKVLENAWTRLLYYAISACQKSRKDDEEAQRSRPGIAGSFRSKTSRERSDGVFWRSHLPTFMTALQVIKVIVVRGSDDISLLGFGIWDRLGAFLRKMLAEGSAEFAFWTENSSVTTTPTGSPRSSTQFDPPSFGSNMFLSVNDIPVLNSPSPQLKRPLSLSRPRMIDYSLWSMLEFIFSYRSPLRLHLKVLTMDKLIPLDRELRNQEGQNTPMSLFPPSPSSGRMSASVFSKPRKHISGMVSSPGSSPRLTPSSSNTSSLPMLSLPSRLDIPTDRRAGYQLSPNTPHARPPGLPKIVHLGPASPSSFPLMPSPLIGAGSAEGPGRFNSVNMTGNTETKSTWIKSPALIRATFRRIRGVQTFMGYDLLLPLPGMSGDDEDTVLQAWTSQQALLAIQKETTALLEEFEGSFASDEDSAMVGVEQTAEHIPTMGLAI